MVLPVYNLNAPLVDPKTGKLNEPWNSFFQQFTQAPVPFQTVDSVFTSDRTTYTAAEPGTFYADGGSITQITLTRGNETLEITGGLIPMSIKDTVVIVHGIATTAKMRFIPR